jgi:hypothetical protein
MLRNLGERGVPNTGSITMLLIRRASGLAPLKLSGKSLLPIVQGGQDDRG